LGRSINSDLWTQVVRIGKGFWRILWQAVVPFDPFPEPPMVPPPAASEPSDEQVEQCQAIYDEVETSRADLEQKARATFSVVSFLAPLIATVFVFILSQTDAQTGGRMLTIVLVAASFVFLLLGFLSIVRAVSIRSREQLFLGAVIDFTNNQIRVYDKSFRMRGLLYCAAVNQAINDHIAQFVKGAHILTAVAVIILVVAALPASIALSNLPQRPTKMEISRPVEISSATLTPVRDAIATISDEVSTLRSELLAQQRWRELDDRISKIESELEKLVAGNAITPTTPKQKRAAQPQPRTPPHNQSPTTR
jgi:hypothetical protein